MIVLASSNGDILKQTVRPGVQETSTPAGLKLIQADLTWFGSGIQPTLIVQREMYMAYPLLEFLLRPLFAILIITTLIWLGLGRWLTHTVKRIDAMHAATDDYAKLGGVSRASDKLKSARSQPDEISDLATSLDKLIHGVEGRNLEQKIYLETLDMLEEAVLELDSGRRHRAQVRAGANCRTAMMQSEKAYDFIHHEDRAALRSFSVPSAGDKKPCNVRLRLIWRAREQIMVECRFVSFRDEAGNFDSVRGVLLR
jgi:hypothetical protein